MARCVYRQVGLSQMIDVATVCEYLETYAPLELAAEWDNVGLLLGDKAAPVSRIMTCLTVTPASAQEAVSEHVDLIASHHPILFRPIQKLTSQTPEGRMLLELAKAGVAVYSPHTAFDDTRDGINDMIAKRLGFVEVAPLRKRDADAACKVVVFVPGSDLAKVSNALFSTGAGHIGQYAECSFRVAGKGTFFGSEAANPTVGQAGRREEVDEWRLEIICPQTKFDAVIAAIRQAHSYEEPAFDIYPLMKVKSKASGEGRIGRLSQPQTLQSLAETAKTTFQSGMVQWVGDESKVIQRLAIVCGSGGEFWKDAHKVGADALLTGEARFHDCLAAEANGLAMILLGHYASERFAVENLASRLQQRWPELVVWPSRAEQDPLHVANAGSLESPQTKRG
jgi:dinuclear metal center YbgI/SA1388 family protein